MAQGLFTIVDVLRFLLAIVIVTETKLMCWANVAETASQMPMMMVFAMMMRFLDAPSWMRAILIR
jgi:hypothetical protein